MHLALEELKTRAGIVLRQARAGDQASLDRFAQLPSLKTTPRQELVTHLQHKHALWLVARERGFPTWKQAHALLSGQNGNGDFGTLLYPPQNQGFLNNWYGDYAQAKVCLDQSGGYLLAYRTQFLVVGERYIETLGLAPQDPDWQRLGYDWVHPLDGEARNRLYAKLIMPKPVPAKG